MNKSLISFLFLVFLVPSAKAVSLCSNVTKECTPQSAEERFMVFQCESSKEANNCAEFYEKNPQVPQKNCKSIVYCPSIVKVADYGASCAVGGFDSVMDLARGVAAFVTADTQMPPEMAEREEFFRNCTTAECKREMLGPYVGLFSKEEIEGHTNDKNLDPKDPVNDAYLNGLSAKTLYRKLLPMLKKKFDNKTLDEPFMEPWSDKPVDLSKLKSLDEMIGTVFEKAGVHNTACYPPEALAEMRCYALTVLLDPFTITKGLSAIRKVAGIADTVIYDALAAAKTAGKVSDAAAAATIAKYPKVAAKVNQANASVKGLRVYKSIKKVEDIKWKDYTASFISKDATEGLSKKLKTMDPEIKSSIQGVMNKMSDKEAFASYMEKLQADAIVDIEKKGIAKELDGLQNGEISENATLRVLVKRAQERGQGNFSMIVYQNGGKKTSSRKPTNNAAFRETIAQGAFFDKPFKGKSHGMSTHLLQQDYISDVVNASTKGNPQKFWDYLGSKEGVNYWVPMFDSAKKSSFTSPEFTARTVRKYIPFK